MRGICFGRLCRYHRRHLYDDGTIARTRGTAAVYNFYYIEKREKKNNPGVMDDTLGTNAIESFMSVSRSNGGI